MNEHVTMTKKQYNALVVKGDNCLDGWDTVRIEKDRDGYIELIFYKDYKHTEEVKRVKL